MIHSFEGESPRVPESAYVAWNAELEGRVELGERSSVWYGAVLRADINEIRVGPASNVQDGTLIHVTSKLPCVLGEGVTVGHGAILHGCLIGDYSLIGMGAIVLDGANIGPESIVGAGALVTQGKSFPPRSMILGSPARVARELSEEEVLGLHSHAEHYAELAARTKAGALPAG